MQGLEDTGASQVQPNPQFPLATPSQVEKEGEIQQVSPPLQIEPEYPSTSKK